MNNKVKIGISVLVCLLAGYFSSFFTKNSIDTWYVTLNKPFFNPPNSVFAPVWTLLYIMMGISVGMIWSKISEEAVLVKKGLLFFGIQLCLNIAWSFLFFGLCNLLLSLIEIIVLLLIIFETFLVFKKIDKKSSYLLVPYMIWVAFAAILNLSIYILNF